jgi:hypothetical protein
MATHKETQAIHAKIVAYVLRHSEQTYTEVPKALNLPVPTLSKIMREAGHRRGADTPHMQINLQELEKCKRPEFPSGATWGMKPSISSWFMKGKRELGVVFAGGDRYRRSGGLRS